MFRVWRAGAPGSGTGRCDQVGGVPLYCGEFGVYRAYAPAGARIQWIGDMRKALKARHIGWAMWDYQSSFGMVTRDSHGTQVDQDVVHALGLP